MGNHVKLDDFSTAGTNGRTLSDKFFMLPLTNTSSVRILAQVQNQSMVGGAYYAYNGTDGGMPGPRQVIPSNGRLIGAQKLNPRQSLAMVIGNNTFDPDSGMPVPPLISLHTFDDSNFGTVPTVAPMTKPGGLGTNGNIDASVYADADGKVAIAANFGIAGGQSRAAYGLYNGAPVDLIPLMDDPVQDNVRASTLTHVRGVAGYVFVGQAPQIEYEIPDDGADGSFMGVPPHRQLMTNTFVIMANQDTAGMFNLAAADVGTQLMPKLALYTGQVTSTQLMTFDPTSFVLAKNAASLADVPVGSLNGWSDDLLYFAGATGVNGTELSILFIDALGRTRAEQKLADTMGRVNVGTITPRGVMGGVGGKYHIAWSETLSDAMGQYDILWYDQIDCL
jgi:hypothetical protein